jgi:thiopeptide-type bacteriocin biosynthesis protein
MSTHYYFHPQLVLRTPSWPFTTTVNENSIEEALADRHFMEAIYLASPALHQECVKLQDGKIVGERKAEKLRITLTRYYARMSSRCTPFGLFAGCAVIDWGAISRVRMAPANNVRHTRLDMHYLCALAQHLATHEDIKPWLRYRPNTTLYRIGPEIRYVEQGYAEGTYSHQISAVDASEPLLQLLAAADPPQSLPNLIGALPASLGEQQIVRDFVEELISAQVLVSELEPTVTGPEFFFHIQAVINRVLAHAPTPGLLAVAQVLEVVSWQLKHLDSNHANSAADYERVAATLAALQVPIEAGKLFQTDLSPGVDATVPATWDAVSQHTLLEALEVVAYLTPSHGNPRLADFAHRFHTRYEDREVPLLEALDNESGLVYSSIGNVAYSTLVHDLTLPGRLREAQSAPLSDGLSYLDRKLQDAIRNREYSVEITQKELLSHGFRPGTALQLPSVGVLFRWVDAERILLDGASGSSAVNLLGRFAHAAPSIEKLIQEITCCEQQYNPDVALAEICHLPASRIGNLLQRPHFRTLEIPYLAQSSLPPSQQVQVQDLRISVRDGQFVLRSAHTNQIIVPRLSTAHNFAGEALPVYQFLCDLQTQGLRAQMGPVWPVAPSRPQFLPRLTYGKVILEAASWHFDPNDLEPLLKCSEEHFADLFRIFCTYWQLPRLFVLVEGDNELLVEADNQALVRTWLAGVRGQPVVILKEFLFDPATSPVRDADGRPYVPQLLAVLMRQTSCYHRLIPSQLVTNAPQREFFPGSEWMYYKLYCGLYSANRVLIKAIQPLVQELLARGWISSWFFVRYADPESHLRVRWHLVTNDHYGEVVQLVSAHMQPLCADGTVWRMQMDTYCRELERYGMRTISLSEDLFCYHSAEVVAHLAQQAISEQPTDSWPWGLMTIDELLNAFTLTLDQKVVLLQKLKMDFAQEFSLDKNLKRQLDAKYRTKRSAIEQVMSQVPRPSRAALKTIALQINKLAEQNLLEMPLERLLGSYVHMLLNRLLPANARLHELVLYDFLFRYYKSLQKKS